MRTQLKPIFFLILVLLSAKSYGVEPRSDLDLECVIAADNDAMEYTKKLYEDIFVVKLRALENVGKIMWKRKHPGASEYTQPETIRGCAFAKWASSHSNRGSELEVKCSGDGEEGSLLLDLDSLEGELAFYYPQIGYPERSIFAVVCKMKSK